MPGISADRLKSEFKIMPKAVSKALGKSLREFGYPSVTDEWVENEINSLLAGTEPSGGPSMFLAGWLKDGID